MDEISIEIFAPLLLLVLALVFFISLNRLALFLRRLSKTFKQKEKTIQNFALIKKAAYKRNFLYTQTIKYTQDNVDIQFTFSEGRSSEQYTISIKKSDASLEYTSVIIQKNSLDGIFEQEKFQKHLSALKNLASYKSLDYIRAEFSTLELGFYTMPLIDEATIHKEWDTALGILHQIYPLVEKTQS